MLQIPQAKPQTSFFKVFVPGNTDVHHHDKIECRNPDNGDKTTGTCMSIITEYWDHMPQWICFETYGCGAKETRKKLENQLPEFVGQEKIKILIIKQD